MLIDSKPLAVDILWSLATWVMISVNPLYQRKGSCVRNGPKTPEMHSVASYHDPRRHACIIWPFAHTESSASVLTPAPFLTPPWRFFTPLHPDSHVWQPLGLWVGEQGKTGNVRGWLGLITAHRGAIYEAGRVKGVASLKDQFKYKGQINFCSVKSASLILKWAIRSAYFFSRDGQHG